jgi:hypothetical protein
MGHTGQVATYKSHHKYLAEDAHFTEADFVKVCRALEARPEFAGIKFTPERITEGGLYFNFADKPPGWYKTVRFHNIIWSWIDEDAIEKWEHSDQVLIAKGYVIETTLKAMGGAPAFSKEELAALGEVFNQHGLVKTQKQVKEQYFEAPSVWTQRR